MCSDNSVSQWIADLKKGDADAARRIWERYAARLLELAGVRLRDVPKRLGDEEDVAASVFHSVCRGAAEGRFQNVQNRDELWWLLLAITKQKVVDHLRRETAQKRGGRQVKSEAVSRPGRERDNFNLDYLISEEPTPEYTLMLQEQYERLLGLLRDDCLRQIAKLRIEGFSVAEIGQNLHLSTRSIERKLQLIRTAWVKELNP